MDVHHSHSSFRIKQVYNKYHFLKKSLQIQQNKMNVALIIFLLVLMALIQQIKVVCIAMAAMASE
jgi:hypothetical protein